MATLFSMTREFAFGHLQAGIPLEFEGTAADAAAVASFQLKLVMAYWGICGCPTFTLNTQQAAVMAATSCSEVSVEELQLPFPIFGVLLSSSLHAEFEPFFMVGAFKQVREKYFNWAYPGETFPSEWSLEDPAFGEAVTVYASASGATMYSRQAPSLLDLSRLDTDDRFRNKSETGFVTDTKGSRWLNTASRIAVGMLLSADHSGAFIGQFSIRQHRDDERKALMGYDEYRFTRPINLDVRQSVRDWIELGTWPSTVRTLVAGHWKLQPHGRARSMRKRIHIMPYWRGDDDAPLAMRTPKL